MGNKSVKTDTSSSLLIMLCNAVLWISLDVAIDTALY